MKISGIGQNQATRKGKAIGTAAGLGAGSAYIAKNAKNLFQHSIEEAVKNNKGKAVGIAIPAAVSAAVIGGLAATGRLAGAGVGKLIDNHNAKKAAAKSVE